jgi:hypothetical protein
MPEGLTAELKDADLRDLFAFLTASPYLSVFAAAGPFAPADAALVLEPVRFQRPSARASLAHSGLRLLGRAGSVRPRTLRQARQHLLRSVVASASAGRFELRVGSSDSVTVWVGGKGRLRIPGASVRPCAMATWLRSPSSEGKTRCSCSSRTRCPAARPLPAVWGSEGASSRSRRVPDARPSASGRGGVDGRKMPPGGIFFRPFYRFPRAQPGFRTFSVIPRKSLRLSECHHGRETGRKPRARRLHRASKPTPRRTWPNAFVRENLGWLRGWVRGRIRDPEAVDDICQEAFLKALRASQSPPRSQQVSPMALPNRREHVARPPSPSGATAEVAPCFGSARRAPGTGPERRRGGVRRGGSSPRRRQGAAAPAIGSRSC